MERVVVTEQLIALIRRMVVIWDGSESGAPAIGGLRAVDGSIAWLDQGVPPGLSAATYRDAMRAVDPFLAFGRLSAGRYSYDDPLDPALRAEQPFASRNVIEHAGSASVLNVTEAHLKLLRAASVRTSTDEGDDEIYVGIDSKRPYGNMKYFYIDMGRILGVAPAGPPRSDYPDQREFTQAQVDALDALHESLQPALQVFLQHAQFKPGVFERAESGYGAFHRVDDP